MGHNFRVLLRALLEDMTIGIFLFCHFREHFVKDESLLPAPEQGIAYRIIAVVKCIHKHMKRKSNKRSCHQWIPVSNPGSNRPKGEPLPSMPYQHNTLKLGLMAYLKKPFYFKGPAPDNLQADFVAMNARGAIGPGGALLFYLGRAIGLGTTHLESMVASGKRPLIAPDRPGRL